MSSIDQGRCKICGSPKLEIFAHTARCGNCGVLLYYPYPVADLELVENGQGKAWAREDVLRWYSRSAYLNHDNFTHMLRFAVTPENRVRDLDVLDYGGGGGQFAFVCKSHLPTSRVHITDIADEALLDEWRSPNIQIKFRDFPKDPTKFDVIFMNDVYEHVSDPAGVLKLLQGKLKPGGVIFVDTPKQFWLYPVSKALAEGFYRKLLRGTVSEMHLQIWTPDAFNHTLRGAGLKAVKYEECSEFTMPPDFYLDNMGVTNPLLRLAGKSFYGLAKYLAKNKITAVLAKV